MFKKLFFIFITCLSLSSFAQYETITFTNSLKKTTTILKDAVPVVNQKNGDVSLFLIDSKKIYGYLFDSNFDIKQEISSEKRSRKYKKIIGYSISENNDYRLFLTTLKDDKFATINFSYDNNSSTLKELDLKLTNEAFLQTVVFDNTFHLISIIKGTSILVLYTFNNAGGFEKNMIDLTNQKFINRKDETTNLYKLLAGRNVEIHKIEENNPNAIELTSEYTKMYLRKNQVVFTIDENKNFTQIITIDLTANSATVKQIEKPFLAVKKAIKKTNSYLFGDNIFMIAATSTQLSFVIQDYKNGKQIKKYFVTSKDTISFKNTPIIQTGGYYDGYREMEKTKKFLRKITKDNIGVSVYQNQNDYHITLGGNNTYSTGGGGGMMMMGGFGGVPLGSFGAVNVFMNPTFFAYDSYTNTKSTHITGLFDKNFNHLKGELQDNVFDKIDQFKDDFNTSTNGETIFRYKDYYIYGHYTFSKKDYSLVLIKD